MNVDFFLFFFMPDGLLFVEFIWFKKTQHMVSILKDEEFATGIKEYSLVLPLHRFV